VTRMGDRSAYTVLVGRHVGERPLGKPKSIWEDSKMDLQEVG
jgi:hypothetical protein